MCNFNSQQFINHPPSLDKDSPNQHVYIQNKMSLSVALKHFIRWTIVAPLYCTEQLLMISSVMSPSENDMRQMRHRQMNWKRIFIFLPGVNKVTQSVFREGASSLHMTVFIDISNSTEYFREIAKDFFVIFSFFRRQKTF